MKAAIPAVRVPILGHLSLVQRLEAVPVPRVFGLGRDTGILFWAWFIWGIGAGLWSYFWPIYLARLGASSVQVGLVIGSASLVATLIYLPGGFVSQLGHHKWQLVVLHLLTTVAVTSFGLAQEWWQVLPGVLCTGLAVLFSPAVQSYKAQAADDEGVAVPYAFSAINAAQFITMTLSPPIGGWIADRYGMHALFPLVGIAYGASVVGMCLLRSRPMPGPGHLDDAAATRRGARAAGWDTYRHLFASPPVRLFLFVALLMHVGIHLAVSFAPLYLRDVYAYDAAAVGWAGSAASAGAASLLLGLERYRRRHGPVPAMWAACSLTGLHFGCTILSPALGAQLVGFFCRGGVQTVSVLTMVALSDLVSRASLAPAVALLASVVGLAAIAAPPVGGWLYAQAPTTPFLAGIVVLAAALPLVGRTYRSAAAR